MLDAIPRLRRCARALVFDAATADDLTQQTLERALSHWRQFDPKRELGVWLLSIAHHAHMDTLRRDARTTVTDPTELQAAQDAAGGDGGRHAQHDIGLRVTVYLRKPEQPTETAFRHERHGELGMFYWIEDGCGYALVGALPRETLLAMAQSVYQQHPRPELAPALPGQPQSPQSPHSPPAAQPTSPGRADRKG